MRLFPVVHARRETALLLASRRGFAPIVELLLERGAAFDLGNAPLGVTPLMAASLFGQDAVVRSLLGRGASVSAVERSRRRTPLHWAALAGEEGAARLLLAAAADREAADAGGQTARDLAAEAGADVVLSLLR